MKNTPFLGDVPLLGNENNRGLGASGGELLQHYGVAKGRGRWRNSGKKEEKTEKLEINEKRKCSGKKGKWRHLLTKGVPIVSLPSPIPLPPISPRQKSQLTGRFITVFPVLSLFSRKFSVEKI